MKLVPERWIWKAHDRKTSVSSQALRKEAQERSTFGSPIPQFAENYFYGRTDLISSTVHGLWVDAPLSLGISKRKLPLITELGGYPVSTRMKATGLVSPKGNTLAPPM